MYIPYSELSNNNKIWVYIADRPFTKTEEDFVEDKLKALCDNWDVHGSPLKSSFVVVKSQLIVLLSDEVDNQASGCSIDSSVRVMKEIGDKLDIDFFNRWNVACEKDNTIQVMHVNDLKAKLKSGNMTGDDYIFKNILNSKSEFESTFREKISESNYKVFL